MCFELVDFEDGLFFGCYLCLKDYKNVNEILLNYFFEKSYDVYFGFISVLLGYLV